MRRILLVGCMVLAGCEEAIVLEVHPAPGVPTDRVQLFIGLGSCDSCPGIQPPLVPEILPGLVFFREDSSQRTIVREAKVEGGVARFRIEASDSFDRFQLAVAVDGNGQSAAVIQNLPLDTAGRYRVDLLPAGGKLGTKPAADGNFVSIWKQPSGTLPCMGFERWEGGHLLGERVFIVPESDLDCDARPAGECAPFGFDAVGVPAIEDATCTTLQTFAPDVQVCKIGGPACDEVSGDERGCSPSEYCLPSTFCDLTNTECLQITTALDLDRCLFETAKPPTAVLQCTVAFRPASDNLHSDLCQSSAAFQVFPQAGTANPVSCEGPASELLLQRPMSGGLVFQDKVSYTSNDGNGGLHTLDAKLRHDFECNYKLELGGDKAITAMAPEDEPVFAQIWVSRSGGPVRKLLVPLQLTYANDCATATTCKLVVEATDSIAKCTR